MRLRYRLEIVWWTAVLVLMGAVIERNAARGNVDLAWLAFAGAAAIVICLFITIQEAVSDMACYALTGQRMPPRPNR